METKYTVDYFIKKFKAIPPRKWGVGTFVNSVTKECCVLGLCGQITPFRRTPEVEAIVEIFRQNEMSVVAVNDGNHYKYTQGTPKARILAALKDIKKTLRQG